MKNFYDKLSLWIVIIFIVNTTYSAYVEDFVQFEIGAIVFALFTGIVFIFGGNE